MYGHYALHCDWERGGRDPAWVRTVVGTTRVYLVAEDREFDCLNTTSHLWPVDEAVVIRYLLAGELREVSSELLESWEAAHAEQLRL